jgi:hypothetical protein
LLELPFAVACQMDDIMRDVVIGGALALMRRALVIEALLAKDPAMLLLVVECPFLRAPIILAIIEHTTGFGMNAIEDDVDVRVLGVVVADVDRLVLAPAHSGEVAVGGLDHLVWRRLF